MTSLFSALIFKRCLYKYRFISRFTNIKVGRELEMLGCKNISLSPEVYLGQRVLLDAESYGLGSISIGAKSEIHDYSQLMCYGGNISIGKNCSVNPFCILYGHGGLFIGDNTRIAAHVVIIPANHSYDDKDLLIANQGETRKGIHIGSDVWIGASCVILDGVSIGNGSIVGAGSIVTKDVSPYSVAVGNPAKVIKER